MRAPIPVRSPGGSTDAPERREPLHEITGWSPRTPLDRLSDHVARILPGRGVPLALAVGGLLLLASLLGTLARFNEATGQAKGTLLLMLAVALVPFLAVLGVAWSADRTGHKPFPPLLVAFLLGTTAALVATPLLTAWAPLLPALLAGLLVTGPLAEGAKLAALRLRLHGARLPNPHDGALLGIAVGAGFAWGASWGLIFTDIGPALLGAATDAEVDAAWGRLLPSLFLALVHPATGGFLGYHLALGGTAPEHPRALAAKGVLLPVALHGAHGATLALLALLPIGAARDPAAWLANLALVATAVAVTTRLMARYAEYHNEVTAPAEAFERHGGAESVTGYHAAASPIAPPPAHEDDGTTPAPEILRAREHIAALRAQALDAAREDWVRWADAMLPYVAEVDAAFRSRPTQNERARLREDLETHVLAVRFQ